MRERVVLTSWVIHLCAAVRMVNALGLKCPVFLARFDQRMTVVVNASVRLANGSAQQKGAHKSVKKVLNACLTLIHVAVSGVVRNQTVYP